MSLVHRTPKKPKEEPTAAAEAAVAPPVALAEHLYVEEPAKPLTWFEREAAERKERLDRVQAEEKLVADAQAARIAKVTADGAEINEAYRREQEALALQIAETNAKNRAIQAEMERTAKARHAAEVAQRMEFMYGKTLTEEEKAVRDANILAQNKAIAEAAHKPKPVAEEVSPRVPERKLTEAELAAQHAEATARMDAYLTHKYR